MVKTVLIVDDEPDILKITTARLKKAGYEVQQAMDGREGLDLIKEESPDLVLLDLALPEIDGREVCRRVKSDNAIKNIPIIFFSASVADGSIEEMVEEFGADGFIVKPFSHEELLEKIQSIIGKP